jgi:stage II sporulation protein AB (anti-sigma F factor)
MPRPNRLRLSMPAREENVAVARALVAACAGQLPFSLPEVEELRIAVSEAVTNAVLHAYEPGQEGMVEVEVEVDREAGEMRVQVRDEGRGMEDVERARRPEVTTLPGHLGLGFAFLEAMTDRLEVTSAPGQGTAVRWVKRPGHGEGTAPPSRAEETGRKGGR